MPPPGINYMDLQEFIDEGYLHEVNRLVLHPLGLAIEVAINEDGTKRLGGIWDYRDDPEGMVFGDDLLSPEKAINVAKQMFAKKKERNDRLGYVIQPIPGESVLVTNYTDPSPLERQVRPDA